MNCTREEFETLVHTKKLIPYLEPYRSAGDILLAFDSWDDIRLPRYDQRYYKATVVWHNGTVIKDRDGIFSSVVIKIPMSSGPSKIEIMGRKYKHECECGAHAVGSNRHSSWCQIKENS
jgi:hypothetical protein